MANYMVGFSLEKYIPLASVGMTPIKSYESAVINMSCPFVGQKADLCLEVIVQGERSETAYISNDPVQKSL